MSAVRRTLLVLTGVLLVALLPQPASARTVKNAWQVDLGAPQTVKSVTVRWSGKRTRRYRVQTSLDGRAFTTAARVRSRRRARVRLRGREARFVRVVGNGRRPRSIRVVSRDRSTRTVPVAAAPGSPAVAPAAAVQSAGPGWSAPWRAGVLPAPLGPSKGTLRYVAPWGSDADPGTAARPWRSISKALAAAVPGDRVLVRAGTYVGTAGAGPDCGGSVGPCVHGSPKGTATAPITVEAYPGERAVIAAMVSIPSAQWFRLSGFVIDGAQAPLGAEGVSLGNTSRTAPSHVEISYNEIRNFGRGSSKAQGILHFSGSDTALVGNRIHHIGSQRFYDHGIYMKAGRRVVVANNVIADITGGYGLHIWGDFDDSWVINNTVFGSAASGFTIGGNDDRGRPDRVVTANNILAGHGSTADGQQGYAAKEYQPGAGNSTRHNLGWANARGNPWQLSLTGPSDNRNADPRFADVAARNLKPRPGSPAVNSAESFGLLLDADRMRRTGAPDKGAYEIG